MSTYWVKQQKSGRVFGPMTPGQLKATVAGGRLTREDMVGRSESGPWQPLSTVSGLKFPEATNDEPSLHDQFSDVEDAVDAGEPESYSLSQDHELESQTSQWYQADPWDDHRGEESNSAELSSADPPNSPPPSSGTRAWWTDSISLGSITESRYPALMAYRNLMVIIWRVFTLFACLAFVIAPIFIVYAKVTDCISWNAMLDQKLADLHAPIIESSLQLAKEEKPLDDGAKVMQLRNAVIKVSVNRLVEDSFELPNSLYRNSVDKDELQRFAIFYEAWKSRVELVIEDERRSLFQELFYGLGYAIGSIFIIAFTFMLYSILLLIPPECIKLAIDVESGIREGVDRIDQIQLAPNADVEEE